MLKLEEGQTIVSVKGEGGGCPMRGSSEICFLKDTILDVVQALDMPLKIFCVIGIYQGFSPHVKNIV